MDKKAQYIGIDVGGTKILLQCFDAKLNVLEEEKIKTPQQSHAAFLKALYELIDRHFAQSAKGIGIAVPGIVNKSTGALIKAPHLPTKPNLRLKSLLEKRYKKPIYVDNDINGFLMAEKERPELKKADNILALMLGTGLGGAMMSHGKLIYGQDGYAGEIGHMIIDQCHPLNTLEKRTSGSAIRKIAKALGIQSESPLTAFQFGDMLRKGDKSAKQIEQFLVQNFGLGLANLNLLLNPQVILLGGSMYGLYLSKHKKTLQQIISKTALQGKAPKLLDAKSTTSVAKGVVMLLKQQNK